MTPANRATARRALVVGVALLGAACTTENGSPPPNPSSAPRAAEPVVLEPEPLWRGRTRQAGDFPDLALRGDALLVFSPSDDEPDRRLLVVDAETGKPRWRLDSLKDLPGNGDLRLISQRVRSDIIVGGGNDWTVFVSYGTHDDETGVAALSGADGRTLWSSPVRVDHLLTRLSHDVLAANDRVVVSSTRPSPDLEQPQVFATDAVTGRRLWKTSGIWPQFVVGDTLLAQAGSHLGDEPDESMPVRGSTVVGLNARTGERKWDLGSRYPDAKAYMVLGDAVVVSHLPTARRAKVIIDGESGETLADLGEVSSCANDRESLIICETGEAEGLVVFDVRKREKTTITARGTGSLLDAWHGYLMFVDSNRILDRSGTVAADSLPGEVIAMSEDYVVLLDRERGEYGVYRRTR